MPSTVPKAAVRGRLARLGGMPALDLSATSVDLTRTICDIPSVSGDETPLADAIHAAVRDLPHLEVYRDGDTIVARTDLGRAQRVAIAGHIDTVPINGNVPTRDIEIDGEPYLWGRGTVDMKAGRRGAAEARRRARRPPGRHHLDVVRPRRGRRRPQRAHPARAHAPRLLRRRLRDPRRALQRQVEGGCNGTLRAIVRTRGVRAHSARAWVGENAIHKAAPVLARLAEYEPASIDVDGLVYREGLNAVRIGGGVASNVIPDLCEIEVNYRFAPSRDAAEAEQHVRDVFDGLRRRGRRPRGGRPPGARRAARAGVPRGGRRRAAAEVRLDGCRAVQRLRRAGRQLRPRRPACWRTTTRSACRSHRSTPSSGACGRGWRVADRRRHRARRLGADCPAAVRVGDRLLRARASSRRSSSCSPRTCRASHRASARRRGSATWSSGGTPGGTGSSRRRATRRRFR